jgi:hypothetical protein
MTTMTTTTTCLFLVVAAEGEGQTIPEPAQVLGRPSPRGTSKTLGPPPFIPTHVDSVFVPSCAYGLRYTTHICTILGYFTHL